MSEARCIIYARISQDRTGDGAGVDRQLEDCRRKAAERGWAIVAELIDNDVSAFSGKPRPAYIELLRLLGAGQANAVIAWHEDRLHRSPMELEHYMDVCLPRNIETDFVQSGKLDLTTASGRMIARVRGAVAREEVEHKSERERAKRLKIAQRGGRHKAGRVYGWMTDGHHLEPAEADVVREIVQRLLAGETPTRIAHSLNSREIPTMKGARWQGIGVQKIATRGSNAALREHKGVEYAGDWEPIISVEQLREVRLILDQPGHRYRRTAGRKHLLTGLAVCGQCGVKLSVRAGASNEKPAYRCDTHQAGDPKRRGCGGVSRHTVPLEHLVSEAVLYRINGKGLAELLSQSAEASDELKTLVAEAESQRRRIQRLVDEYATTDMWTPAEFARAKSSAQARLDELERDVRRQSLTRQVGSIPTSNIREWWDSASVDDRRHIIELLIESVAVKPTDKRAKVVHYEGHRFDPELIGITWRV